MSVEILCDENLLWSVTDGQIKLTQNGDYEMSGTWSGTLTGIGPLIEKPSSFRLQATNKYDKM
ncbi:hypothetical protein [Hungatella effluvii]|uniref:hypothetical protein n=1 Tax=Hungatella effluvii TaxID=1096246 RepID=UPI000D77581B|nr:hypothetical protein [Hungatella effluvii]